MKLQTINVADILKHDPCYRPTKYVSEDWSGTLVDILKMETVPEKDRIWCVTRFLSDKTNRLFAVWCAREALKLIPNPDPRSVSACDVAERFANGEATKEEILIAHAAAAEAAAVSAENYIDQDAASAALYTTIHLNPAKEAAYYAASYSAEAAHREQVNKLIEILEA